MAWRQAGQISAGSDRTHALAKKSEGGSSLNPQPGRGLRAWLSAVLLYSACPGGERTGEASQQATTKAVVSARTWDSLDHICNSGRQEDVLLRVLFQQLHALGALQKQASALRKKSASPSIYAPHCPSGCSLSPRASSSPLSASLPLSSKQRTENFKAPRLQDQTSCQL